MARVATSLLLAALAGCSGHTGDGPPRHWPPVVRDSSSPDSPADSGHDSAGDTPDSGDPPAEPPIFLVFLADDLGANAAWAMSTVTDRLAPESVRFGRAYVTVPLCCPVRTSFLSGGLYPSQTGMYANDLPNGGITLFHPADTLATRLQAAGFATALVGKYINGWEDEEAPAVPPGWDLFLSPTVLGDYTNSVVVRGSSTPDAPSVGTEEGTGGEYLPTWLAEEALAFLDEHPDEPVFLLLTPQSPHIYATPAAEDLGTWADYQFRPPSFAEEDISDKPAWLQRRPPVTETAVHRWDAETELMMENAVSLDRSVEVLLDGLTARGLDDRTTLFFTGDNGHLHGEHRLVGKALPYEESVAVPLYVRGPGLEPRDDARLVAMNLDLPATVAEAAGLPAFGEGIPLTDALTDPDVPLRDHIFLDGVFQSGVVWAGVVTERWKYVEWGTGETELYDRDADPYELESLHAAPPPEADLAAFAAWTDEHRALAITSASTASGAVGVPFDLALAAWGGTPPLTWSLDLGVLPTGLSLSADGVVSGTPTEEGIFTSQVRVTESGVSSWTGQPQSYAQNLTITIGEAERMTASRDGGGAVFRLAGRPGQVAQAFLTVEDTRDSPPIRSERVVIGADGRARIRIPTVDGRPWRWYARVDGALVPGGILE